MDIAQYGPQLKTHGKRGAAIYDVLKNIFCPVPDHSRVELLYNRACYMIIDSRVCSVTGVMHWCNFNLLFLLCQGFFFHVLFRRRF